MSIRRNSPNVVIVGGGIAGLAAAYQLVRTTPDVNVTLIEREPRLGGKILTERIDGFVVEGGPDSFLAAKPAGVALCRALGIEDELQGTSPESRGAFILRRSTLYPLPEGLSGLVPARLGPLFRSDLLTPSGKLRFAAEYVLPARQGDADESLAAFMRRRFGSEIYDRLMDPLMTGIYAGDGDRLSLQATFPQLRALERENGSVLRGLRATSRTVTASRPRAGFLTPIAGMGEIVEALRGALGAVHFITSGEAKAVDRSRDGYQVRLADGETVRGQVVILTTPAFVSANLTMDLDPGLAQELSAIPYASTATVSLAFPRAAVPAVLRGTGWLAPRQEGRAITALTWVSSKFDHRAPQDSVLLRGFIGRAGQEEALEADDSSLVQLVRREIAEIHGITAEPTLQRVFHWPRAMPQYTLGHLDRLGRVEERLAAHPGLLLAGSAFRGVGIPDCIASGETAAAEATSFITRDARSLLA